MYQEVKDFFKQLAPFTDDELIAVFPLMKEELILKDEYFSKAGRISDRVALVQSGAMRSFYNINDKEITTYFHFPGSVAAALVSFLQMKPALENIQALEDTLVMSLRRKELYRLYRENWKWQQVGRVLTEQYYVKMERRSIVLQTQTAQERYQNLLKEFPPILRSVPLQYIASYLGISPETLSRIRRNYVSGC